ncbi:MAG: hypothetical protein EON87_05240 [Brevundimonas sp.]|nr:MAG: hypothetical protein EON87_05240 [Brevundimonas sp.]
MSSPVIKAICRRIESRMGGGKNAALAAGVSGGLWSQYCSDEHPTITIPTHRLLEIAAGDERRAIASLFTDEEQELVNDLVSEASEVTEGAAELQGIVRLAAADGKLTLNERRRIREKALQVRSDADDVLKGVG